MKKPSLQKKIQWHLEQFTYAVVEKTLALFPLEAAFTFGEAVGRVAFYFFKSRANLVQNNLQIATKGALTDSEIHQLSKDVFERTGANLVSSLKTSSMSLEDILPHVDIIGIEKIPKDKGTLLLLKHMGNWELLAQVSPFICQGRENGALYRPLNNPYLDASTKKKRELKGTQLFSRKKGLISAIKLLRNGGNLGVLIDQRTGKAGVEASVFGKQTKLTPLPQLLTKKTDCNSFSLRVKTTGHAHWEVRVVPLVTEDIENTIDAIANDIEESYTFSLTDVFWMHRLWKENYSSSRSLT